MDFKGRMMTRVKRLAIVMLVLLLCVGCDQAAKFTAKGHLAGDSVIRLFGDTVRLQYAENQGAFLGLGASLPKQARFWVFTAVVFTMLAAMLVYLTLAKGLEFITVVALSLVLAGGIGNLIDRAVYDGAVIDFLNVGIGDLRTGIFNLADVAITTGVSLLVLSGLFERNAEQSSPTPGRE